MKKLIFPMILLFLLVSCSSIRYVMVKPSTMTDLITHVLLPVAPEVPKIEVSAFNSETGEATVTRHFLEELYLFRYDKYPKFLDELEIILNTD